MGKIRLLVVDDHQRVRQGLVAKLEREPDFQVVGHTGRSDEALRQAAELHPHVVLLDVKMEGGKGIETCRYLAEQNPQAKVFVLTSFRDEAEREQAYRAGAQRYLLKDIATQGLIQLIRERAPFHACLFRFTAKAGREEELASLLDQALASLWGQPGYLLGLPLAAPAQLREQAVFTLWQDRECRLALAEAPLAQAWHRRIVGLCEDGGPREEEFWLGPPPPELLRALRTVSLLEGLPQIPSFF